MKNAWITHEAKHNSIYLKEIFMRFMCKNGGLFTPLGLLQCSKQNEGSHKYYKRTSFYLCMVVCLLFFVAQCKMILQNIHHSISPLIYILLLIFGLLLYKIYPYILTIHEMRQNYFQLILCHRLSNIELISLIRSAFSVISVISIAYSSMLPLPVAILTPI